MISAYEKNIRQFKLWRYIDRFLIQNEFILQSTVVEYAKKENLGSKKSVISILTDLVKEKILKEVEIKVTSPGRPKKGYSRSEEGEPDIILVNLSQLPDILHREINSQSELQGIDRGEGFVQIITYLLFQYLRGSNDTGIKSSKESLSHLISKMSFDFS